MALTSVPVLAPGSTASRTVSTLDGGAAGFTLISSVIDKGTVTNVYHSTSVHASGKPVVLTVKNAPINQGAALKRRITVGLTVYRKETSTLNDNVAVVPIEFVITMVIPIDGTSYADYVLTSLDQLTELASTCVGAWTLGAASIS